MSVTTPGITVFGPIDFPTHPMSNITPFTYRDGATFLEMIEDLKDYIFKTLIPGIDGNFADLVQSFLDALEQITEDNNETIAEFDALFTAFKDEVALEIASLNNLSGQIRSARAYGATGDGVTNDAPFIQAAINATPDGGTTIVEPGTYVIGSGPLLISGKSITLDLTDAVIQQKNDEEAVSFQGTLETALDVSSITVVTTSGDETPREAVQVTLSAPVTWARGDVVKLVADDVLPGSRTDGQDPPPANQNRVGQFFTVQAMNEPGTVATLMGVLRDPFTINPRIARLLPITGHLVGGDFQVHPDFVATNFNSGVIQMLNLQHPTIKDTKISRSGSQGIGMGNCYGYVIDNVMINYARNEPGTALGYGINDGVSEFGKVSNCHFIQTRHAWTTGANAIPPDDLLSRYGRTYGTIISACSSQGGQHAGFDTHIDADNVTFTGCFVADNIFAYNLRGRNHNVFGCSAQNVDFGVNMSDEALGHSYGHTVDGLTIHGHSNVAIRVQSRQAGHPQEGVREQRQVYVRNVNLERGESLAMQIFNSTVVASNIQAQFIGVMPDSGFQLVNSYLLADHINVDFADTLTGNIMNGIFALRGEPEISRLALSGCRVTAGSIFSSRVNHIIDTQIGTAHLIQVEGVKIPVMPGLRVCNDLTIAGTIDWAITSGSENSQYASLVDAELTSTDALEVIRQTRTGRFTLRTNQVANVQIAPLPNGNTSGQEMTILNKGVGTVTILHGSAANTSFLSGSAKVLAVNESVRLIYVSDWMEAV